MHPLLYFYILLKKMDGPLARQIPQLMQAYLRSFDITLIAIRRSSIPWHSSSTRTMNILPTQDSELGSAVVGVIVFISEPAKGLSFLGLLFKVKVKKKKKMMKLKYHQSIQLNYYPCEKKYYHLINP